MTIKEFRVSQKLSQGDLADALYVSRQAISKWETGASVPDLDNIVAMSRLFHVSTDYIIKGEEMGTPTESTPPQESYEKEQRQKPETAQPSQGFDPVKMRQIFGVVLLAAALLAVALILILNKDQIYFLILFPVAVMGTECILLRGKILFRLVFSWTAFLFFFFIFFMLMPIGAGGTMGYLVTIFSLIASVILAFLTARQTVLFFKNRKK